MHSIVNLNGMKNVYRSVLYFALAAGLLPSVSPAQQEAYAGNTIRGENGVTLPAPPATAKHPVTEDIHGETFTDNYRWLEDGKSAETRAWIAAQSAYTDKYLAQIRKRPEIVQELTRLQRVDSTSIPYEVAGFLYYSKRLAGENQASIYRRQGLHGSEQQLVDAGKLSADQNTSVNIDDVSEDGKLLAYGVRSGGADEQVVHMLQIATGEQLDTPLSSARYSGINLAPDNKGVYYSKLTAKGSMVFYHAFGKTQSTRQTGDQMIFGLEYGGHPLGALDIVGSSVTKNGRYLIITIAHGVPAKRTDILARRIDQPAAPFTKIVYGIDSRFSARNTGDDFYLLTDYKAPNGRVLKASFAKPGEDNWQTILPEGKNVISDVSIAGGKLYAQRLVDAKPETSVYSLAGVAEGKVQFTVIGSGSRIFGRDDSHLAFFSFESFIMPPAVYSYDTATGKSEVLFASKVPFNSDQYEVKQVFFTSKDGTRVPMFIAGKKGLTRDGSTRTLMTGYGGFNISELSSWNADYAWWMEQGGYFAEPNLRGGGEYGENWHQAGMFEKKQNVFDDWFGAAEYLIANHYTSSAHLAIRGRSNGGLLMGASITQRPDLYGAIWCGYPLLDMLRYQNFLIGRWWTTEYGSAEDPQQFSYIRKYSPYQNVHVGTKYPTIMFFTGDSDTRVAPLHARKMAALMQAANGDDRPILLHYSLKSGHSAGVSVQQLVDDEADELAFLWNETGGK